MPISIPYTFTQTATTLTLDLQLPLSASTASTTTPDLVATPLFLKLSAPPALLTVDLSHAILPHTATLKRQPLPSNQRPRFTLHCTKETAGEWAVLEWKGSKDDREARRRQSVQWWEEDEARKRTAKSEQRRQERKEDRERGWEWQRQQKERILAAKGRERVVALDELKAWQQQQTSSKREVWEAKTGETIELIEDDDQDTGTEQVIREEKTEERKYPTADDKPTSTQSELTPPTAAVRPTVPPPPVRSTTRLTTTFTAVHPTLPSLPARESNAVKADVTAAATDVTANLLQLKDKADAYYKRKDIHSAITAYTQLLDDEEVRHRPSGSESQWRYGWVVCRVLSNRSACYMALATRSAVAALAQQLGNVQRADEDAREALELLGGLTGAEASEEDKRALDEKLRKRLVAAYSMQGLWDQALPHTQAAELKEEEATVSHNAAAVRRGDDVQAQQEAEQLLARSPMLLSAALRRLNTALALSPLSLTALQLRLDVYGRLGEWDKAVRDAVLGVALCERTPHSQQRLWWIGRRGECYIQLKQFSAAQADLNLLSSSSTPYTPLTAASLPALLSSLSHQQRHHTLLLSLPALRSSSSYVELKSALSSLLSLQSSTGGSMAGDEWMVGQVELVSEQGWCELKLGEYETCIASCSRAQTMWSQWIDRPQPSKLDSTLDPAAAADQQQQHQQYETDDDVAVERRRVAVVESERRVKLVRRVYRWRVLTSVRKATALCYAGRLREGRDEYGKVLQAMHERQQESGYVQSDEERRERQEVEADVIKIEAAIAMQAL